MAEVTGGNAVVVQPGDTLVVAFADRITAKESDSVVRKIAAGFPASVRVIKGQA